MTLIREVEDSNPQIKKHAPAYCSKCGDAGHRAPKYLEN
jgi:hypothetical protein